MQSYTVKQNYALAWKYFKSMSTGTEYKHIFSQKVRYKFVSCSCCKPLLFGSALILLPIMPMVCMASKHSRQLSCSQVFLMIFFLIVHRVTYRV